MTFPLIQTLQEYWFNNKEAVLYAFVLNHWASSLEEITTKFSMTRQEVLIHINKMIQYRYIVKTEAQKYTATPINKLINSNKEICRNFTQMLPCFYDIIHKYNNFPKLVHYEWISWLKKYYNQQLTTDDDIFAFLGTQKLHPALISYLYDEYVPKRVAKWIYAKVILSTWESNKRYIEKDKEWLRETRIINNPLLVINSEINLFSKDKVGFALFSKSEMSAIIIQSEQLYTTLKSTFDLLWTSDIWTH